MSNHRLHARMARFTRCDLFHALNRATFIVLCLALVKLFVIAALLLVLTRDTNVAVAAQLDPASITITSDCHTASARVDGAGFYPAPVVHVERDELGCVVRARVWYEVRRVWMPVVWWWW